MRLSRGPEFEEAFDDLFERAHRVAARVVGTADAEDVAAEALARAYLHWRRIGASAHRDAWVARVAVNLALDRARRRRPAAPIAASYDPVDGAATRLMLVEAVGQLPRRQRDVIVLRYLADLTEAQVALQLGVEPATVKEHASRGRTALRRALGDDWEERHAVV